MGGYGLYVWGSFGMCALVLSWEAFSLRLRRAAVRRAAADEADEAALTAREQGA
ncbi:MAG: heme exporter protein CcmD [Pseudomonadota bacterium]